MTSESATKVAANKKVAKGSDLEAYVSAPGRDKLVKEVREKINHLGIEYIYPSVA